MSEIIEMVFENYLESEAGQAADELNTAWREASGVAEENPTNANLGELELAVSRAAFHAGFLAAMQMMQ